MSLEISSCLDAVCSEENKLSVATFVYDASGDLAAKEVEKNLELPPTPIKRKLSKATISLHSQDFITLYNQRAVYGYSDWKLGEKTEIAGK